MGSAKLIDINKRQKRKLLKASSSRTIYYSFSPSLIHNRRKAITYYNAGNGTLVNAQDHDKLFNRSEEKAFIKGVYFPLSIAGIIIFVSLGVFSCYVYYRKRFFIPVIENNNLQILENEEVSDMERSFPSISHTSLFQNIDASCQGDIKVIYHEADTKKIEEGHDDMKHYFEKNVYPIQFSDADMSLGTICEKSKSEDSNWSFESGEEDDDFFYKGDFSYETSNDSDLSLEIDSENNQCAHESYRA